MASRKRLAYLRLGTGPAAHVNEITEGLRNQGWTVEVFEPDLLKTLADRGYLQALIEFTSVQMRLLRQLSRFDALYIRHHPLCVLSVVYARLRGIPVVQEMNGQYEDAAASTNLHGILWYIILLAIRVGIRLSDAIVVVTPDLKRMILDYGDNVNVCVIPNAANPNVFFPGASGQYQIKVPYVIWFGNMGPWQGIRTMIEATCSSLWPEGVQLVMVGDGTERRLVEDASKKSTRILVFDPLPQSELAGLVSQSLAGLSTQNDYKNRSSNAGLAPIKMFETLACGVPVIASDFPGISEMLKEGNCGIVIPSDSPADLARAVAGLWENDEKRIQMGKRGREFILARHSWSHRAKDTSGLLEKLIESHTN